MSRTVEQIIEDEVRRWMYQQASVPRTRDPVRTWPVITVSREFGAGGSELGVLLGERTGFTVWDRKIVEAIAEESGCLDTTFNSMDERPKTAIEDIIHGALMGSERTNIYYIRALIRIVRAIASHGRAVIVGRGAHCILRDTPALRVRVVCPLELRIRRYAEKHNVDLKQAGEIIRQKEKERIEFVRLNVHRDMTNASDYDLVLSSGSFDMQQLADLVVHAYRSRFGLDLPIRNPNHRTSREPIGRSAANEKQKGLTLQ